MKSSSCLTSGEIMNEEMKFYSKYFCLLVILLCNNYAVLPQTLKNDVARKNNIELGVVQVAIPLLSYGESLDKSKENVEQTIRIFLSNNKSFGQEMKYKGQGKYELSVPRGIYFLEFQKINGNPINYQRANFSIYPKRITKISIPPFVDEVCDKEDGFVVLPTHISPKTFTKPKFDNFLVTKPFNLVIKFCERQVTKNYFTYKFAWLSYNDISIAADKIIFNKKKRTITAFGSKGVSVWVEAGEYKKGKDKITIDLSKPFKLVN